MKKATEQGDLFKKPTMELTAFRIQPDLWESFKRRAEQQDVPASFLLRQLVRKFVEENQQIDLIPRNNR